MRGGKVIKQHLPEDADVFKGLPAGTSPVKKGINLGDSPSGENTAVGSAATVKKTRTRMDRVCYMEANCISPRRRRGGWRVRRMSTRTVRTQDRLHDHLVDEAQLRWQGFRKNQSSIQRLKQEERALDPGSLAPSTHSAPVSSCRSVLMSSTEALGE